MGDGIARHPGMTQPIWVYRPSIAPSDLTFLTGHAVEAWCGGALVGAPGLTHLNRLTLDGDRVIHEERVFEGLEWRVRLVEEGPDGIYVGTDAGLLVRLTGS